MTLFLLVVGGICAAFVLIGGIVERWHRSEYRAYVRHRKAIEAMRKHYVPLGQAPREHRSNVVRAGAVK